MGNLLEKIDCPQDIKALSIEQLEQLAKEIRQFILDSVSKTGGHLASNLGVVELTLALHYVFDFSRDKLLWDVGHQCYAHKIITGRRERFGRLRKADGPSGFPDPSESEYDQFIVGHAGTAVATATGMALGRQKLGGDEKVVAVVGDASIVNGLSFEALNNLGLVRRQLLIVLNDNSMAIDPTQGAVAKYLSRVRLSHTYEDIRRTTSNILEHLPIIGRSVEEIIERIKKSVRMVVPPSQLFESLNIPYFGPVDGYDVCSLVELFRGLAELQRPAILHVYTKKGKGFEPAENGGGKFHSTGPFKLNGEAISGPAGRQTFTEVFGRHLVELAEKDNRIVAITSAMCDGTGLAEFRSRFPERFYDVGIAESAAVDMAAGLAKAGLKPVVAIYSTFLQRSFDQIMQEVALQRLPVVFCIDRAGLVGADGPTHHGLMDIGFLRMMPNIVLAAPAGQEELCSALEFALSSEQAVAIRYPKDVVPDLPADCCRQPFRLGRAVFARQSQVSRLAIVNYGCLLDRALVAAERLCSEGIETDVVNARFAVPLDEEIIELARAGKGIIALEDHSLACGFGSAVLEAVAGAGLEPGRGTIVRLGVGRRLVRHDARSRQLADCGLDVDNIVDTARRMYESMVSAV